MANEKRLVNAEAIARKLKNAHCAECNVVRKVQCSACWVDDVLELLDGDTVDAVEVKHGRWISRIWSYGTPMCSVCDWSMPYSEDSYLDARNYCPNCGAKMMGDTK